MSVQREERLAVARAVPDEDGGPSAALRPVHVALDLDDGPRGDRADARADGSAEVAAKVELLVADVVVQPAEVPAVVLGARGPVPSRSFPGSSRRARAAQTMRPWRKSPSTAATPAKSGTMRYLRRIARRPSVGAVTIASYCVPDRRASDSRASAMTSAARGCATVSAMTRTRARRAPRPARGSTS